MYPRPVVIFISVIVLWIFSLCLHEYAHARVAYAGGDTTVEEKGYLEFNPLRYTDPLRSIGLPILCLAIGGIPLPGGSVWINRSLLRSPLWDTAVSLAGPITNLLLAVAISLLFRFGVVPYDMSNNLSITLSFFVFLQVFAFVLNLLPVPGFDGFGALAPWLPWEVRQKAESLSNFFMVLIFILMWQVKPIGDALFFVCAIISALLGIDGNLIMAGSHGFRSFS
jgi:Zn-dependent protease